MLLILYRSAAEDSRAEVARVLLNYSCQGIIESLRDNFDRPGDVKSLDDYVACCRSVQLQLLQKFRHFIFVSGKMLRRMFVSFPENFLHISVYFALPPRILKVLLVN